MKSKGLILLVFAVAAAALVWKVMRGGAPRLGPSPSAPAAAGSAPVPAGPRTQLTIVFGTEKEDWMRAAADAFRTAHPDLDVELVPKGSLEAAQEILDGKLRPTVWSPADSLVMTMLDADWRTKNGAPLFAREGELAPQPVLLSPLVFVVWEDRAQALLKAGKGELNWKAIRKAVASNKGWLAVGGKADWGFVKLGHTDPTRSNSGLQALWSMTLEFYGRGAPVRVEQLLRPDYQAFVSTIEHGVTRFEPSTGTFMVDMVRFGPSKYDIAVVYESLAIAQIANAEGRWGDLHVYYPQLTAWSDHPAAIPQAAWVSDAQRAAARQFVEHLRSHDVQARALAFGFRPADPAVPIKGGGADNPFTRLAPHGLRAELPPVSAAPDAEVVRNLLTMWSRMMAGTAGR